MKKIYLHIGCGKTGSSALQLWLHDNSPFLQKEGFYYPTFGNNKLHEYSITSGNGVHLIKAIREENIKSLIINNRSSTAKNLIYSSEAFQGLQDSEIKKLKENTEQLGYELVIIAYVRDVYDIAYSSYLQLVKRHLMSKSFEEFAFSMKKLQQFEVIKKFERNINNFNVIHYDSEKDNGLDVAFCKNLSIECNLIPAMKKNKVNRSLTVRESELMRLANQAYKEKIAEKKDIIELSVFSPTLSDALIYNNPEQETEILFNPQIIKHFQEMMRPDVLRINKRYFDGKHLLRIFNAENKKVVRSKNLNIEDSKIIIETIIKNSDLFSLQK